MKTAIKIISSILMGMIVLQGGITSKTTLAKAIEKEHRIKIKPIEGPVYSYKKLIRTDSTLHGVTKIKGKFYEINLSILNISKVSKLENEASIFIYTVGFLAFIFAIAAATYSFNPLPNGI